MKVLVQVLGTLLFVVIACLFTAVTFAVGGVVAAIDSIPRKRRPRYQTIAAP